MFMPNWIRGSIKFRGKLKDIIKFFDECVEDAEVEKDTYNGDKSLEYYYVFLSNSNEKHVWYLKGSDRAFITDETNNYIVVDSNDLESIQIMAFDFKQAWGFETDYYKDISSKYDIDIRLYGIERGMGFTEEIEIIKGEVILNSTIHYYDFDWECPFPWYGG